MEVSVEFSRVLYRVPQLMNCTDTFHSLFISSLRFYLMPFSCFLPLFSFPVSYLMVPPREPYHIQLSGLLRCPSAVTAAHTSLVCEDLRVLEKIPQAFCGVLFYRDLSDVFFMMRLGRGFLGGRPQA